MSSISKCAVYSGHTNIHYVPYHTHTTAVLPEVACLYLCVCTSVSALHAHTTGEPADEERESGMQRPNTPCTSQPVPAIMCTSYNLPFLPSSNAPP